MATGTGTAILDFGAAPGGNVATVTIVGQTGILATDQVGAWWMGDSTADHSTATHVYILPLFVALASDIPNPSGSFSITATSSLVLVGTVKCRWAWST